MRPIHIDKRGDLFQLIPMIAILLIISVFALLTFYLSWKFTGELQQQQIIQDNINADSVNDKINSWLPLLNDEAIIFFFLGMTMALIISAVKTNFNPAVIFFFIILLLFAIFLAAQGANIYRAFADEPQLASYSSKLTFTNILWGIYTPLIITMLGAILLVIMYGKSGGNIGI